MWDKLAIKNHIKSANLVCRIKDQALGFMAKNKKCTEFEVMTFILNEFRKNELRTDSPPMVAFRSNTSRIHYVPQINKSKVLKENSLIMLDLWAGLKKENAPFADITWMAYLGEKIPPEIRSFFMFAKKSRDIGMLYIKKCLEKKLLPVGAEVGEVIYDYLEKHGMGKYSVDYTGHSLGVTSSHGRLGTLNKGGRSRLKKNVGYTLEPELNIPGKFGMRLELDFYISKDYQLNITSDRQKSLRKIMPNA